MSRECWVPPSGPRGPPPIQPSLGSPGRIADEWEVIDKVLNQWETKTSEPLKGGKAFERQDHALLREELRR